MDIVEKDTTPQCPPIKSPFNGCYWLIADDFHDLNWSLLVTQSGHPEPAISLSIMAEIFFSRNLSVGPYLSHGRRGVRGGSSTFFFLGGGGCAPIALGRLPYGPPQACAECIATV